MRVIYLIQSSCGNQFKIKVTVKDHKYKTVKEGDFKYKCCTYCGKTSVVASPYMPDPNWNPTEDEIYQKMVDIVGEDLEIYGPDEVPGYKSSWVCEDWTSWIMQKTWGIAYKTSEVFHYAKEIEDFSKARCGDIVYMHVGGVGHVAMVVKNYHDGRLVLTGYSCGTFDIGPSDEEYEEICDELGRDNYNWRYTLEIVPYDFIEKMYTYYKD